MLPLPRIDNQTEKTTMNNSFNTKTSLKNDLFPEQDYYSLKLLENNHLEGIDRLPFSLKVLLENLLRHENGNSVTQDDIKSFKDWLSSKTSNREIAFHPTRVLMQDFTGVPAVVDLAAMRDAMASLQQTPKDINPLCPVDLVIDHSVQVDAFGNAEAFQYNVEQEMQRNNERYSLLKWGQESFNNFRSVPPGTGICHQVNLEYLSKTIWSQTTDQNNIAYPDTLVGTDSHTTMVNGLGVLGWGVGGIEAEAAMLGQPISMLIPEVIGFNLEGELKPGITATDLVLTIVEALRKQGVVGKFVEFYGTGLKNLPLADRATIANMAPEYGATCGFFPIDEATITYLTLSNRSKEEVALVEAYAKEQGMWYDSANPAPVFTDTLSLDLSSIEPCIAGPRRPQDRVLLNNMKATSEKVYHQYNIEKESSFNFPTDADFDMHHGDIVIAAITSCTNTSNPSVMLAAGLLAKNACEKGITVKPWVKTSLAPGSKVVTDYLKATKLLPYLDQLGFDLVGYGCTTCIGNSGPLPEPVEKAIVDNNLMACAVLSGNRNFEGRIHPHVKANWLASPPLVVAYALAGNIGIDLETEPLGTNNNGDAIYLKDIWPSPESIADAVNQVNQGMFAKEYAEVFAGDNEWQAIPTTESETYDWQADSTYIRKPPFFEGMQLIPTPIQNIEGARILALLGDSVTTDHISPAGSIQANSPAGQYLQQHNIDIKNFNSYGARRGNHEVMMRGTFANIRIRNALTPEIEGGFTRYLPTNEVLPIFDAATRYKEDQTPLVVIAGKEYGTGSSRDWAAKGTLLLGVKAVITESFERIHRSNLIGMGVLPLQFPEGVNQHSLNLDGTEFISLTGIDNGITAKMPVTMTITRDNGDNETVTLITRIDTDNEAEYFENGGILQYVLRKMINQA